MLFAALCELGTVTSSSIKVDNLVNLVRRMSLHGDEENQHKIRTTLTEAEAFAPADSIDPANEDDVKLNPDSAMIQDDSIKKRSRKLTEKGLCLKKSTLHNRRKKMNSRLLRQAGAIEDLMYTYKNMVNRDIHQRGLQRWDQSQQVLEVQEEPSPAVANLPGKEPWKRRLNWPK